MAQDRIKIICQNRKARFNYHIVDVWEAGMVLKGTEVKSLRDGRAQLVDSYAVFRRGELFLLHAHISEYPQAGINNHEPTRSRKLLLNKKELHKIKVKLEQRGLALIPLKLYFKRGLVKVELGLGRGKRQYDKRQDMKLRDAQKDIDRYMR